MPEPSWTKEIKAAYRAGSINFVNAVYELRQIGHTPEEAQKRVYEWIVEKHKHEISDTLDAATITIVRMALAGDIDAGEAMKRIRRAQRLAQVARYRVSIATYQTNDLSRIARMLDLL